VTSESYDSDRPLVEVPVLSPPSEVAVAEALRRFEGQIEQVPPAVSAVKVGGRPAYELERQGRRPELKARTAHMYWIHLHRYAWPEMEFEMACGGEVLQTGGCLTALRRTAVGPFVIADAWTLDALGRAASADAYLVDLDRARQLLARQTPIPKPSSGSENSL
jgi:tRNA pseudouridine55 synthase